MPTSRIGRTAIRAVLFDVDGTLYAQWPLRVLMAIEMAAAGIRSCSPSALQRLARIIGTFRNVREELRSLGEPPGLRLEQLQFTRAAERLRMDPAEVRQVVEDWMVRRPAKYLRALARPGLSRVLDALVQRGLRLGVLSDYPAADKLQAMHISRYFSVTLTTVDPSINAFKPHPKGFWHACDVWGVAPEEVLYVGDRDDTDAAGAAAAGMQCFILSRRARDGSARALTGSLGDLERTLAR